MYKIDITAKDLISIMEANKNKPKEILTEQFSKAITDAMNNGKRYAYVYVPFKEYYCNTTDTVIKEFIANGYGCERTTDELNDDAIKVSW